MVVPAQAAAFPFAAPTGLRGVISTSSRLQIAWDSVSAAPSYRVHYSTTQDFSSGVKGVTVAQSDTPTTVLSSLTPNTQYYFRVAVLDGTTLQSPWSDVASYRTKALMKIAVASFNVHDPDSTGLGPWSTRCPRVAEAIVANAPYVVGLQEIYDNSGTNPDRDTFLRCLAAKAPGPYAGGAFAMTPAANSGGDDYGYDSRIIYKPAYLRLLSSGTAIYPASIQVVKDNGVRETRQLTWAKFQDIASGKYVLFTSTHLTPRSDALDVKQWQQLVRWVKSWQAASSVPLYAVITGDFNVTKFESPASTQLSSMRANGYDDILGQIYRSYSTYRNPTTRVDSWIGTSNQGLRDVRANGGSVSPGRNSNSIDYIFVSHALKAPYYRVYAQPRTGYIMNYLASDHFLVRATVSE